MNYEILSCKLLLSSLENAFKLSDEYMHNIGYKTFLEQQKVLNVLSLKHMGFKSIDENSLKRFCINIHLILLYGEDIARESFNDIKDFNPIFWREVVPSLKSKDIIYILDNYYKELPYTVLETLIFNLKDNNQREMIKKYINEISKNEEMYHVFYYAVEDESRKLLDKLLPNKENTLLLELNDLDEEKFFIQLEKRKEEIIKYSIDDILELILLKTTNYKLLNKFFKSNNKEIDKCSNDKFKLLFSRYKYLVRYSDDEYDRDLLTDNDLYELFIDKFHDLGIEETLSLFNNEISYGVNRFTKKVILDFIDIAYDDCNIKNYINDETIDSIIREYTLKLKDKEYTIEEFYNYVDNIDISKEKIIHDDYIRAIMSCRYLMENKLIDDTNEKFILLRKLFVENIFSKVEKDGTYNEKISFNGLFYRVLKGSIPFELIYSVKKYKGLIYLSKCGNLISNPDYVTNYLTDNQLAHLDLKPLLRLKKIVNRTNTRADNLLFIERMGLELICYFGEDKAKYLLESDIQGNRMENLFDRLNYENIKIDINRHAILNKELIDYLFGKGSIREKNTVINKMIRNEIPEFEKYFPSFCERFNEIKEKCQGILTIKRILRQLDDYELPIELKPDEIMYEPYLREMNTTNVELLKEAIELLKLSEKRVYSTIPKVKGTLGKFKYEILDLKNPLSLIVGYLSHCCFVVDGISKKALRHALTSNNGRIFVVYYDDKFFAQSWVWRNGDVICFDSVEAGSTYHGAYIDDLKLVDVYIKAAQEIYCKSKDNEDEIQRVKVITIGKSDYQFSELEKVEDPVPRPLEKDLYIYDSNNQNILTGQMPVIPRYGEVGIKYLDDRYRPIIINNIKSVNIDYLDEICIRLNSLRYKINGIEIPLDILSINKIILGDDWYIIYDINNNIEHGVLTYDNRCVEEYNEYIKNNDIDINDKEKSLVKRFRKYE